MTKAELMQAVIDRGFNYEDNSSIGRWVENAYQSICARHPWPFLEDDVTGEAPLEISDLRKVLSVKNTAEESQPRGVDRRWLVANYPNLTDSGPPEFWYLENKTLNVYPVSTATLAVRYLKIPTALGESDTPLIPTEFQDLIVDRACVDALKSDDEYTEARALRQEVREAIDSEMVPALFNRNLQNSASIERTGVLGIDYI